MRLLKKQLLIAFFSLMSVMFFCDGQALAATFSVNSNGAASDAIINGTCETAPGNNICTLHAAIQEANNASGSTILFTGQFLITDCSLPPLTAGGTTIDAHNQWDGGFAYGSPGVSLRHPDSCGAAGTILTIASDNNFIYGLRFVGSSLYKPTGLEISSGNSNTIGADLSAIPGGT